MEDDKRTELSHKVKDLQESQKLIIERLETSIKDQNTLIAQMEEYSLLLSESGEVPQKLGEFEKKITEFDKVLSEKVGEFSLFRYKLEHLDARTTILESNTAKVSSTRNEFYEKLFIGFLGGLITLLFSLLK